MRELYYVNYYKDFRCIGPACESTCCAMWEIEIDDKSYEKYKNYPGKWGERFAASIDPEEQCFRMNGKDCIFLNDKHLCDIQAELGEDMLCRTCKTFPRHMEEYGSRREFFLSLACPEAARHILFKKEPAFLYRKEREAGMRKIEPVDKELLEMLLLLREGLLKLLYSRSLPFSLRLCMVLALGHDAQRSVKQRNLAALKELLSRYEREGAGERFRQKLYGRLEDLGSPCEEPLVREQMKKYLHMLEGLEILDEGWTQLLSDTEHILYGEEPDYPKALEDFWKKEQAHEDIYLNLVEYFLMTYLLGALYDGEAYSKVKFALYSMLVVRELYMARDRKKQREGAGELTGAERVELACWYSREVENSRNNLEALDMILQAHPEFILDKMLACLSGYIWKEKE